LPLVAPEVRDVPKAVLEDGTDLAPTDTDAEVVTLSGQIVIVDPVASLGPAGFLGTRAQIEAELDIVAAAIRGFHRKQADQVMREVAAYSARLTELAVLLHRAEGMDRQYTRVRTQQVERFLAELDRQFKIASRLVEVMRQDLELMR
jgi:hypothetical protein